MKKINFILLISFNFIFFYTFSQGEFVVEINSSNGSFIKTGPAISGINWVSPGFRAYNENNGRFIFPSNDNPTRLYSIDVSNDSIINNPIYSNLMVEFEYNNTSNILYGLLKDNTNNVKHFASIDQTTGVTTTIGNSIPSSSTNQGISTFNQTSNQYIFLDPSNKLFSIDVLTGSVVSSPILTLASNEQIVNICYDNSTNILYGFLFDNNLHNNFLVSINTTNGIVTRIGSGMNIGNFGSAAIDELHQHYFHLCFIGTSYYISTLDLSNGNVISNNLLPTVSNDNFFSLKYDKIQEKLYSIHWETAITAQISALDNLNRTLCVYPNPFQQTATIEFINHKNENCILTIFDNEGRLVETVSAIATDKFEIERKNLANGIYFFQLRTNKQIVTSGKLIIE